MYTLGARRSLKYIFFFAALLLTGGFFAFMTVYQDKSEPIVVEAPKHQNEALQAHYEAVDQKGQPYIIDADKAYLQDGSDEIIVLVTPTFRMTLNNNIKIFVKAKTGLLNQETKKLTLSGFVKVHYGDKTTFEMPITEIDLKLGSLFGNKSLKGNMDQLDVQAGHFDIQDRGAKITLTDHPVLRFNAVS